MVRTIRLPAALTTSSALALTIIAGYGARASNLLEINYRIIAKYFRLGHDIEMVLESILVGSARLRTPLSITVIGAQIRNHDGNRLPSSTTSTTGRAWGVSSRGQGVACSAASSAPGQTRLVEDGLGGCRRVDTRGWRELYFTLLETVTLPMLRVSMGPKGRQ